VGEGWGRGQVGEMTQTMYAHVNKQTNKQKVKRIKNKLKKRSLRYHRTWSQKVWY
jgi:hypothetical protein